MPTRFKKEYKFIFLVLVIIFYSAGFALSGSFSLINKVVTNYFLQIRSDLLTAIFLWFSGLGSAASLTVLALFGTLALLFRKQIKLAILLAGSQILNALLIFGAKLIIALPRPASLLSIYSESTYSFPSGHAAGAFGLCVVLIFIIWKTLKNSFYKVSLSIVSIIAATIISVSRLYLGVHYLTDILGGVVLGLLISLVSILIYQKFVYIQNRLYKDSDSFLKKIIGPIAESIVGAAETKSKLVEKQKEILKPVLVSQKAKITSNAIIVAGIIISILIAFSFHPVLN